MTCEAVAQCEPETVTIGGDQAEDIRLLTSEIASGNPEAFARLYRAKFAHVYAVARKVTRLDEQACLDIVQDTMMRVIRYMKPMEDPRTLDNWLARVTRTVAFDQLRSERRRRIRERKAAAGRATVAPDDTQEILERIEWLRRELRGLDRVAGEIIELRFRAGMTLQAIGQRLGMGTGAVHGRLMRALGKLRKRTPDDE